MNSRQQLESYLSNVECNTIIEANKLYLSFSTKMTELAFYKALERLCKQGILTHLAKSIYYKPKNSRFGVVSISEKDIVSHYTKHKSGLIIGYQLYNKVGLTTQVGKQTEVLSSVLKEQNKKIKNVVVRSIQCELNAKRIAAIETLEILQNYKKIENLCNEALVEYMNNFASIYSDKETEYVIENIKYKKSTIAFLRAFLNHLNVKNSLDRYLSVLSSYDYPSVEEIYAAT